MSASRANPSGDPRRGPMLWALSAVVCLASCAGCAHPDVTRRQQKRLDRLADRWREFAEHEATGEARVAADLATVGWFVRKHEPQCAADLRELNRLIAFDAQRWRERAPLYGRAVAQQIEGHPQLAARRLVQDYE